MRELVFAIFEVLLFIVVALENCLIVVKGEDRLSERAAEAVKLYDEALLALLVIFCF